MIDWYTTFYLLIISEEPECGNKFQVKNMTKGKRKKEPRKTDD